MTTRYDTYCGLYCGACSVMRANEEGRIKEQAKEWERQPEEITCHGCKSGVLSGYCKTCEIKACASEKGLEFCIECEAYPCKPLIAFRDDEWPHHSVVTRNSDDLKRRGLERWLQDQAKRWSCPTCSHRTSWYDQTCPSCGEVVVSSRDEEQDVKDAETLGGG